MAEDEALRKLELFTKMQQSEAGLHWQRNSYFLLVSSILLVAASQFSSRIVLTSLSIAGLSLNLVWLLIQDRSSQYTLYWKNAAKNLKDAPEIYSEQVRGVEMRIIGYLLPLPFIFLWLVVLVSSY